MQTDARAAILGKIRAAIGAGAVDKDPNREWEAIPRDYRKAFSSNAEQLRHLLIDRLQDYDAHVRQSTAEDLTNSIAQMLRARGVTWMLVPPGLPADMLPKGFKFVIETGLAAAEMNQCDGILTQSTLAIAETGTIVLQNIPGQGRRAASLVPDYHLCVVDASRIVATVPEAIALLQGTATLPTTFISGPSATADIEMTRIKGVHGPRFLDVILISN